jgi:uncharacterized protein
LNIEPIFVDTAYIYALFNKRDQWHTKAVEWQKKLALTNRLLITTQFILTEIADGLSPLISRKNAVSIINALEKSDLVETIPASSELFHQGLKLYESRTDKDWGLTDCISFCVMNERNLYEALTTDDHFRQAGFRALMLED